MNEWVEKKSELMKEKGIHIQLYCIYSVLEKSSLILSSFYLSLPKNLSILQVKKGNWKNDKRNREKEKKENERKTERRKGGIE